MNFFKQTMESVKLDLKKEVQGIKEEVKKDIKKEVQGIKEEVQGVKEEVKVDIKKEVQGIKEEVKVDMIKVEERLVDKLGISTRLSESLTTIGNRQQSVLSSRQTFITFSGTGRAVLEKESLRKFNQFKGHNKNISESSLLQWFTPILQELVKEAALRVGHPLVLVNCERHLWVKGIDSHASDIGPDMLITHPAFFQWAESEADTDFGGEGFQFGTPAHWYLRDSIQIYVEWKKKKNYSALGQAMRITACVSRVSGHAQVNAKRLKENFFLVGDAQGFYLVECLGAEATKCTEGEWDDPGSRETIIEFISRRMQRNPWVDAIQQLCTNFSVSIQLPSAKTVCFLGLGADGRVFQVCSATGDTYALKVALEDSGCSRIREEYENFVLLKDALAESKSSVGMAGYYAEPMRQFSGLLIEPVGKPLEKSQHQIMSALHSLKSLTLSGMKHGDARLPNVMWVSNKAVWLDFRKSFLYSDQNDAAEVYAQDVETFVHSFQKRIDSEMLYAAAKLFFRGQHTELEALLCPLWSNT
jgi:hypothetical protein